MTKLCMRRDEHCWLRRFRSVARDTLEAPGQPPGLNVECRAIRINSLSATQGHSICTGHHEQPLSNRHKDIQFGFAVGFEKDCAEVA
jgi:hypothetical protein